MYYYETLPAQEQDKDKINKRKSKRFSKFIAHNDELNLDLDEPPVLSKIILSSTTGRTSSGSDFEEDDEDLIGTCTLQCKLL